MKKGSLAPLPGYGLRPGRQPSSREQWLWFLGGCLAALIAGLAFEPWRIPLVSRDSTFFFYAAERAAHGVAPHISAYFPQLSLSALVPAGFIWLGEMVGVEPLMGSRVASLAAFAITIGALGLATLRITGSRFAAAAACVSMLSFTWQVLLAATGSQSKTILTLFVVLALLAMSYRKYGWAAAAATGAALCYQVHFILPPLVLGVALLRSRSWDAVGRVVLGSVAVLIPFAAYMALKGALAAAIDQSFVFPLSSGRLDSLFGLPADLLLANWRRGAGPLNPLPLVFVVSLIWLLVSIVRAPRAFLSELVNRPAWLFFLGAAVPFLYYGITDHNGAADFMLILPFVCVLSGVVAAVLLERVIPAGRVRVGAAALALIAALAVTVRDYDRMQRLTKWNLHEQRALAEIVGDWLDAGRSVYALGATHLLAFNEAPNWSIYSLSYAVRPDVGYFDYVAGPVDFVPAVDGRLPDVILWNAGRPRGWPAWLEEHYVETTTPLFGEHRTQVWEKKPAVESV